MSKSWTFSPSSELYLKQCIAAAPQPDLNNKWYQKFGTKASALANITEKTDSDMENSSPEVENITTMSYEDFFETIESEASIPVEYVIKECSKNPALISKMAGKLTTNKVEELFEHILNSKNVDYIFLTVFITKFLPTHIKVHNSRLCIDILVKVDENYPQIYKKIIEILMNDIEIPNQMLNNYIAGLNEDSATLFIQTLSSIEVLSEGFIHNIVVIYTAYKNSIKNDLTQNYIQKLIIQHNKSCVSDRNFGRLFLTFLQTEKMLERKICPQILECLEAHRSPFKRPCTMILKNIVT